MNDNSTRKTRKGVLAIILVALAAVLSTGAAYAIAAMTVTLPLFPSIGEATAQGCDPDGVSTAFTYGNSSANGVKVTSATVSGIANACTTARVEFIDSAGSVTATYSASVASGSATMTTNIFTNQFNDVRVTVSP